MEKLVLIGGGGHCKVVIDTIRSLAQYEIAGIVDSSLDLGCSVFGVPVIGRDEDLVKIKKSGVNHAFVALGSIGKPQIRQKIAAQLMEHGFFSPVLVHIKAYVASSVALEDGVLIAAGAMLQPGVKVGRHAIINTGALIDHDGNIGSFAHISPGAVLSGCVTVGEGAHVGTGTAVAESRQIGDYSLVGAGSTVVKNIPNFCKAYGNPCKVVEQLR